MPNEQVDGPEEGRMGMWVDLDDCVYERSAVARAAVARARVRLW